MIGRVRKMLSRHPQYVPVVTPSEHEETALGKEEAARVMDRADRWMEAAMRDADRVFAYLGPDRRRKPR